MSPPGVSLSLRRAVPWPRRRVGMQPGTPMPSRKTIRGVPLGSRLCTGSSLSAPCPAPSPSAPAPPERFLEELSRESSWGQSLSQGSKWEQSLSQESSWEQSLSQGSRWNQSLSQESSWEQSLSQGSSWNQSLSQESSWEQSLFPGREVFSGQE
uniref:Uncharacterized protein n=1 Tax=Catharus ustulatus TaxID=91951 RepID=A0A8C3UTC6_CATUS